TKDEMVMFIHLQKATSEQSEEMFKGLCAYPGGWVLQAIDKRFSAFETEVDKKTMIMILYIGDGIVGKCAKYVDDVVEKFRALEFERLDFEKFTKNIYPM